MGGVCDGEECGCGRVARGIRRALDLSYDFGDSFSESFTDSFRDSFDCGFIIAPKTSLGDSLKMRPVPQLREQFRIRP